MTILRDVLGELFGMFVSDARLTGAALAVVLVAAALIDWAEVPALAGGGVLLAGSLLVLLVSVRAEARRRTAPKPDADGGG